MAAERSYDEIVGELKREANKNIMGYASDMVADGDYVVIINVVRLGLEDEYGEEEGWCGDG